MCEQALEIELVVKEVVQIRKLQPRIGTRKLQVMLQEFLMRNEIKMGRDALFDVLSYHGLLIRRRRRKPITTFSGHWLKKYDNLIEGFYPGAPGQLWVSDITYIEVGSAFAYLSLITDAYSHKIVGFHLSERLTVEGCIYALKIALKQPITEKGLIHHSDRGSQYCSSDYVELLTQNHIHISMTQTSDPRENAIAERVNGILKQEFLLPHYATITHARIHVAQSVTVYNHLRPHSSCNMLTPVQAHSKNGQLKKHWKNYYLKKEVIMK
jgi:transposase InsO family protein